MHHKALSVRSPLAAAILLGGKDVENRSWNTTFRGRLYVHVGSRSENKLTHLLTWERILAGVSLSERQYARLRTLMDIRGAIIGSVEVVDCVRNKSKSIWALRNNFHWMLANPRVLRTPVAMGGRLGLFNIDI